MNTTQDIRQATKLRIMPRKGRSPEIITTTPEQRPVIGYVVRYERGVHDDSPSRTLQWSVADQTLYLGTGFLNDPGSVFFTVEEAHRAVTSSIAFQRKNRCNWNAMYGAYLIEPVAA